jgi:SAM-dependent methyltransferase
MNLQRDAQAVLAAEQLFFDEESAGLDDVNLATEPRQMARYRNARLRATNIPKETMFAQLGSLKGRRVLEYGCGTGHDSCHFADCGADVTAFDLSPISIQKAKRRAQLLGLSERIKFDVKAAGRLDYAPASFDVVAGIAILHHLHQELGAIYEEVSRLLRPGGVACFIEPAANSRMLRALRPLVPVPRHATPDERQLLYADFELMKQHGFRDVQYDHFYCLARLQRVIGKSASIPLRWLDHYAQRLLPAMRTCYGIVLVTGRR